MGANSQGDLLAVIAACEQTNAALRESEQRFKRLLASVTDYVYTVTLEHGRPVATSHGLGCEAVTGYTPAEFGADSFLWFRLIHEEDRPAVLAQAEEILKGQPTLALEHRIIHKDGRIRWIRNTSVPHKDEQGQLLAYDGLVSDISAHKHDGQLIAVQSAVSRELALNATFDEVLSRILECFCEIFRSSTWKWSAFWSLDAAAKELHLGGVWHTRGGGMEAFEAASRRLTFAPGVGLPGQVWASGVGVWIPDVAKDPEFQRASLTVQAKVHGACAFPIRYEQETLGVIELLSSEVQPPDSAMLRVLESVGCQIGQFIKRKHAEEQLRLSVERLQDILDYSPAVIHLKDLEGRYLLVNRRFEELYHQQRKDVLGKLPHDLFSQETANALRNNDQKVVDTRAPLEFEETLPQDGRAHTYVSLKFPLFKATGEIYALCGISTDITTRKQAEDMLRESQERLALVLQGSNDGMWDWNLKTDEVYFSPRWSSMLGYEEHELANNFSTWERLLHPDDRKHALALIQAYFSGQTPTYELEHRLRHKDGSYRWILARGVALRDAAGKPVRMGGSHLDLTERKHAENQLQQANAKLAENQQALERTVQELISSHETLRATQLELIQAAKLESVGTLAAGVAHEIKNPLQTILMSLDYLDRNLTGTDEITASALSDMREAVSRANRIVEELMQLSAPADLQMQPEDLNHLVEHALWLMSNQMIAAKVNGLRQFGDLPRVIIDQDKIVQVFINLFINALQAMSPQGGLLTVTTRAGGFGEDLTLSGRDFPQFNPGDKLVVAEVQDSGPGIRQEDLPRLFDPFFTTKPVGVGNGLGLSVVKTIVELHAGAIHITNGPQGGALVTLVLRAEDDKQQEKQL